MPGKHPKVKARRLPEVYEAYLVYYQRTRQVSDKKVKQIRRVLRPFERFLKRSGVKLAHLRIEHIDAFLAEFYVGFAPGTCRLYRSYLRGFLKYLYQERGILPGSLKRSGAAGGGCTDVCQGAAAEISPGLGGQTASFEPGSLIAHKDPDSRHGSPGLFFRSETAGDLQNQHGRDLVLTGGVGRHHPKKQKTARGAASGYSTQVHCRLRYRRKIEKQIQETFLNFVCALQTAESVVHKSMYQ